MSNVFFQLCLLLLKEYMIPSDIYEYIYRIKSKYMFIFRSLNCSDINFHVLNKIRSVQLINELTNFTSVQLYSSVMNRLFQSIHSCFSIKTCIIHYNK